MITTSESQIGVYHDHAELFPLLLFHIRSNACASPRVWYVTQLLWLPVIEMRFLSAIRGLIGIPTEVNGGNHTRAFAAAARTPEAHRACFNVAKSLAAVGIRVLTDDAYLEHVRTSLCATGLTAH